MRKKIGKRSHKPGQTRTASAKSRPLRKAGARKRPVSEEDAQSKRFVEDLLTRGEAAKPTEKGRLPTDATHVVTKENPDGTVEVKRVRYKSF